MTGTFDATYIVTAIVTLVVSLVIHEFMHAYVGHLLGDTTAQEEGRLTLNPLKHIDPYMTIVLPIITLIVFHAPILAAKPVPFNPARVKFDEFGAALIAAAGPLSNLVLAVIGAIFVNHIFVNSATLSQIFITFTQLNVLIFVFNLIPIPPLDGSRVLYAFAPEPLQDFMRTIEPYGLFIVFGLVFLAGLGGLVGTLENHVLNILSGV